MRIVPQVHTRLALCATTNRACFGKVMYLQEASVDSKVIYRLFA